MTTDIELLPLPPLYIAPSVEPVDYPNVAQALMDYARANVSHATAPLQAEIEALRVRADAMAGEAIKHEARAERLAEALRGLVEYVQETAHHNAPAAAAARAALRDHDQEAGNG